MRIAISLNASDVDPMEAQRAFSTAVRALRKAGTSASSVTGSFHAGELLTVDVTDVPDSGSLIVAEVPEPVVSTARLTRTGIVDHGAG